MVCCLATFCVKLPLAYTGCAWSKQQQIMYILFANNLRFSFPRLVSLWYLYLHWNINLDLYMFNPLPQISGVAFLELCDAH